MNSATAGVDRQLLVEVLEASEKLLAFQTSQQWDAVVGTSKIQESYARISDMTEGRILPTEQDVDDTDDDSNGIIVLISPSTEGCFVLVAKCRSSCRTVQQPKCRTSEISRQRSKWCSSFCSTIQQQSKCHPCSGSSGVPASSPSSGP